MRKGLFAMLIGLAAGSVGWAAKECEHGDFDMPNLDTDGMPVFVDMNLGQYKYCVNTKKGTYTLVVAGDIINDTQKSQTLKNNPELQSYFDVENAAESRYKVSKRGSAKFKANGVQIII